MSTRRQVPWGWNLSGALLSLALLQAPRFALADQAGPTPAAAGIVVVPAPTSAVSPPAALPVPAVSAPATPAPVAVAHDAAVTTEVTVPAVAPRSVGRFFGLITDVGLPEGANLGLVIRPVSWARLHAAGGTNTASLGFRGGVTVIPYWFSFIQLSLNLEGGFCRVGDVNAVLRTFFQVPGWMKDYAQQAGYSYYNAHLGLEFGRRHVTGFIHAGGSYVSGTARMPTPVPVTTTSSASSGSPARLILGQDANIQVYTLSFKAGLVVFFGGL